jgi:hypothetical protein
VVVIRRCRQSRFEALPVRLGLNNEEKNSMALYKLEEFYPNYREELLMVTISKDLMSIAGGRVRRLAPLTMR